ncbi:hypothetical protein R1sor_001863 [Riccia sorocarpa]|uniref:Uncharacterized protein n=1 Tax=Riccia sorocarpa TaxID=122646 RepID=A0ABD3GYS7_9MARC
MEPAAHMEDNGDMEVDANRKRGRETATDLSNQNGVLLLEDAHVALEKEKVNPLTGTFPTPIPTRNASAWSNTHQPSQQNGGGSSNGKAQQPAPRTKHQPQSEKDDQDEHARSSTTLPGEPSNNENSNLAHNHIDLNQIPTEKVERKSQDRSGSTPRISTSTQGEVIVAVEGAEASSYKAEVRKGEAPQHPHQLVLYSAEVDRGGTLLTEGVSKGGKVGVRSAQGLPSTRSPANSGQASGLGRQNKNNAGEQTRGGSRNKPATQL